MVAQAILKANGRRAGPVYELLAPADVSRRVPQMHQHGAGSFDNIRLLPGRGLEVLMPKLLRALAADVIDHCPYHLRWLEAHRPGPSRELILRFVTDARSSLDDFWAAAAQRGVEMANEVQEETLLAMRGMLAYGLAPHCLCRRHRVEYGVDARRGLKVRVAEAPAEYDPSNHEQLARLHAAFGHNMACIDFWLGTYVLPRETMQFPHRLVANAFHLTAPSHTSGVMGFSGTRCCHHT